jgi:alanyl-tRNA synthetase
MFKIISENAIAAGIRRIEAICSSFALDYMNNQEQRLNELANILKTPKNDIVEKVANLLKDKKYLEDELSEAKKKLLLVDPNIIESKFGEITLIEKFAENIEVKDLRNFVDHMRQTKDNSIIVAASKFEGKTSLIIGVHANLLNDFDASSITRQANELAGGQGGGGRKELAQAGGFDYAKLAEISKFMRELLKL